MCFPFPLRARIETMSSISESLQCSQRINETVSNPYSFDDYMRAMAEHKGIKEGWGSRWQTQPQSPAFFLPQDLYNLNSIKYAVQESHFLKVYYQKEYMYLSFSFSFSGIAFSSFFNGLSVLLVFSFNVYQDIWYI